MHQHQLPEVSIQLLNKISGRWKGKPCIKVHVVKKTKELMQQIPSAIEGYIISIEGNGVFKALDMH